MNLRRHNEIVMNLVQIDKPKFSNTMQTYHQNRLIQKVHFRRKSEAQYSRNKTVPCNKGLCSLINCCKKPMNHDSVYSINSLDSTIYRERSVDRRAKSVNESQMKHMEKKCNSEASAREENKTYNSHNTQMVSNMIDHPYNNSIHIKKNKNEKPPVLKNLMKPAAKTKVSESNSFIQDCVGSKKLNSTYKMEGGRKAIYAYDKGVSTLTKHCADPKQMRSLTTEDKNRKDYPNYKKEDVKYAFSHSVIPNVIYNNTYCDHRDLSKNQTHYDMNRFGALENYKYVGYVLKSDRQSRSKYKPREIDIYNNMIENKNGKSTPPTSKENSESSNGEEIKEFKERDLMKNDPSVIQSKREETSSHNINKVQNTKLDIKETSSLFKTVNTEESNSRSITSISNVSEKRSHCTKNEEGDYDKNSSIIKHKNIRHMKMNIDFFNMDENVNISIINGNTINKHPNILNKDTIKDPIEPMVKPLYVDNECQTRQNYAPKKIMKGKRRIRIIRRIKRKRTAKKKPRKIISIQKKRKVHGAVRGRWIKPKKKAVNIKIKSKAKTKMRTKFVMKRKPKCKKSRNTSVSSDKKKKTQLSKNEFKLNSRKHSKAEIISKLSSTKKENEEKEYLEKETSTNYSIPTQMNHSRSNNMIHKEIKQNESRHINDSPAKRINQIKKDYSRDSKKSSLLNTFLPEETLKNTQNYTFTEVGAVKKGISDTSSHAKENADNEQYHKERIHEESKANYFVKCNETQIISSSIEASKTAPNVYVKIQIDNMYKCSGTQNLDSMDNKKKSVPSFPPMEDTASLRNAITEQNNELIGKHKENKVNVKNTKLVVIPPIDIIGYRLKTNDVSRNRPSKECSTSIKRNTSNNAVSTATLEGTQQDQTQNHSRSPINDVSVINSASGLSKEKHLHTVQIENNKYKIKSPRQVFSNDSIVEPNELSPLTKKIINILHKISNKKSGKKESNTISEQAPCNHTISNISSSVIRKSEESNQSMEKCKNEEGLNFTTKENNLPLTRNQPNTSEEGIVDQANTAKHLQELNQFRKNVQEGKPTSNKQKVSFLLYFILFYSKKLKNIINLGLKNTSIDDSTFNMKFFILCLVNLVENCKSNILLINTEFCNLISDLLDKIKKYIIRILENKVGKYQLMLTKVYLIELLKHTKLLKLCVDSEEGGNNDIDNIQIEELMKIDNLLLERQENSSKQEDWNAKQHPYFLTNIEEEFLRDWNHAINAFTEFENPINKSVSGKNIGESKNNQVPCNMIKYKTIHHPVVIVSENNRNNASSMVNINIPNGEKENQTYINVKHNEGSYKKDSLGNTIVESKNEEFSNIQYKINKLKEEIKQSKTDNSYNMDQRIFFISHLDYLQEVHRENANVHLSNEETHIRLEYVSRVLDRIREIMQRQNKQIDMNNGNVYNIKEVKGNFEEQIINPTCNNTFYTDSKNAGSHELLNRDSSWFTTEMIPLEGKPNAKRIIRTYKQCAHFDETEELKELNKSLNSIILSKDEILSQKSKDYYSILQMYNQELSLLSEMTNDHYISDYETENGTEDEHLNHMNAEQFYNFIQWIKRHKEGVNEADKSNGIRNFEMSQTKSGMLKNLYSTFLTQEKHDSEIKTVNFINKLTTMEKDDLEHSNPFHNMEDTYNDQTCDSSIFHNEDDVQSENHTFKEGEENEKVQYFKIGS